MHQLYLEAMFHGNTTEPRIMKRFDKYIPNIMPD